MSMPKQAKSEGLDQAAKIKIGISCAALAIAAVVLITYVFDISLFGGDNPEKKAAPVTEQQAAENKRQLQENKEVQEKLMQQSGSKATTSGS